MNCSVEEKLEFGKKSLIQLFLHDNEVIESLNLASNDLCEVSIIEVVNQLNSSSSSCSLRLRDQEAEPVESAVQNHQRGAGVPRLEHSEGGSDQVNNHLEELHLKNFRLNDESFKLLLQGELTRTARKQQHPAAQPDLEQDHLQGRLTRAASR